VACVEPSAATWPGAATTATRSAFGWSTKFTGVVSSGEDPPCSATETDSFCAVLELSEAMKSADALVCPLRVAPLLLPAAKRLLLPDAESVSGVFGSGFPAQSASCTITMVLWPAARLAGLTMMEDCAAQALPMPMSNGALVAAGTPLELASSE